MKCFCTSATGKPSVSYINTSEDTNPQSGYCFFAIGSDSTSESPQDLNKYSSDSEVSTNEEKEDLDTTMVTESRGRKCGERPKSSIYRRSLSDQNERKRWHTSIQEPDSLRTVHDRSLVAEASRSRGARANKCISCPVLSEVSGVMVRNRETAIKCNELNNNRHKFMLRMRNIMAQKEHACSFGFDFSKSSNLE
jgi:hypothetical protein